MSSKTTREKYLETHIDEIKAWQKDYYQKNKESIRKKQQKYEQENRGKFKVYQKQFREKLRLECLTHYGGNPPKCACCGETEIKFLTIDHINGGGNQHYKLRKKSSIYQWLVNNNFPEGYQVLCYNCNCAKGHYGVCPHQIKKECFVP